MAHEIYEMNGKQSIAYVNEVPWHGLGQKLTEGASLETWIEEAGFNYEFLQAPVEFWDNDLQSHTFTGQYVNYRSDNKEAFSVVSGRYNLVQPREAAEFFRDFAEAGDMELETMGSIKGGRKFWALARINHGTNLDISEKDKINPYVLIASSADKTMSTIARFTGVRVVCNNTLTVALGENSSTTIKVPHSTKFRPELIKEQMGLVPENIEREREKMKRMSSVRIGNDEAFKLFFWLSQTAKERDEGEMDVDKIGGRARKINNIMESFTSAPGAEGTLWGAVNAVTNAVDFNPSARAIDTRLNNAWFGQGETLKNEAYELCANEDLVGSILERTMEMAVIESRVAQAKEEKKNESLSALSALVDF